MPGRTYQDPLLMGFLNADGITVTPISSANPLPGSGGGGGGGGGDASAANQTTEIARLTSLVTNTTGLATAANQTSALPSGENHIGEVGGSTAVIIGNFTRPSDTAVYASADLVANSTTAGSVVPVTLAVSRANDKPFTIPRLRLKKSSNILTNASFRVHLYRNSPTIANGDNAAWSTTESEYLGAFDITMDKAFTDLAKGIGVPNTGSAIIGVPASGTVNIFALIEARAAYTPISGEVFTITVEVLRD